MMTDLYANIASHIAEADYVLIGGGSGLTATSTIDYLSETEFSHSFPYLAEQGIKNRWDAIGTRYDTPEEYWAFWAQHVLEARFDIPAGQAYQDLFTLVGSKEYFIFTTNVEDQFIKAGFDPARLFTPQGNYGYFQCAKPCRQEIWPNEEALRKMVANMDVEKQLVRTEDIPVCPNCGGKVYLNLRNGKNFVEGPWMGKSENYAEFISTASTSDKNLLILELGVGFNTPSIIRSSFEWYAKTYAKAFLIRFNRDYYGLPPAIKSKSLPVPGDIKEALQNIALAMV